MGRGQGRRGRGAGGRTTSRMALCRPAKSAAADATLEPNALHIGPSSEDNQKSDWADFAQQRPAAQQREQNPAKQIATTRIWTIDRKTGDVSYLLNGRVSVIDRGRLVTVLNQDDAAIVFGLEMAIQKYGSRITCTGTDEWKRMVTSDRGSITASSSNSRTRRCKAPFDREQRICESSPTSGSTTAFHRNQAQN